MLLVGFLFVVSAENCAVKEDCYPDGFVPSNCGTFYSCYNNQCAEGSNSCAAPNSTGGGSPGALYCEKYPFAADCICKEGIKTQRQCTPSESGGCSAIVSYECVVSSGANVTSICEKYPFAADCICKEGIKTQRQCTPSESGGCSAIVSYECVVSSGANVTSICEKYHICPDGTKVQYCFIHTFYDEEGNPTGKGCGCKNQEFLCIANSTKEGGYGELSKPELIPSAGSKSLGSNENPIVCTGCILGDKCAPIGYRTEEKYCNLQSEFVNQEQIDISCENNFECSSNVCVSGTCVSEGLLQKILNWFKRLFGDD